MGSRPLLQRLLLVAGALVISLGGLEVGLRVFSALAFSKMMVLDDTLGWKHVANGTKTFHDPLGESVRMSVDKDGLRGPPRAETKPPGVYRILALGDSFAEGAQVNNDELFSARLENSLRQTEVLNAGIGAYSTVQEYLYLQQQGLRLQPDLVLLLFFDDNDLPENTMPYYAGFGPRPYAKIVDGAVQLVLNPDPTDYLKYTLPAPFRLELNRHSYLYYFLNRQIYQRWRATEMQQWEQDDAHKVNGSDQFRILFWLVDDMQKRLAERGIDFVLVLVPASQEAASGRSATIDRVESFCQQTGMRCLSLLERFHHEPDAGRALYFLNDIHWTKEGHRVAADEIRRYLASHIPPLAEAEH